MLNRVDNVSRIVNEALALFRKLGAATMPTKNSKSQVVFQPLYSACYGCLRDAKLICRTSETSQASD
jgi:hypothetical protein